jgi:hypothetical protein
MVTICSTYGRHLLTIWSASGRRLLGGARHAEHREAQDAQQIKAAKDEMNAGKQKRASGGQEEKNARQATTLTWWKKSIIIKVTQRVLMQTRIRTGSLILGGEQRWRRRKQR